MQEQQNVCIPVGAELGTPVDPTLFADFEAEFLTLADQEQQARAYTPEDLATGEAALRAVRDLGCAGCELSGVCTVGDELQEQITVGAQNRETLDKLTMLASAPAWLVAARLSRAGTDIATVASQIKDLDTVKEHLGTGTLDLDTLLSGVANKPDGIFMKKDVPELATMAAADSSEPLAANLVTTANGVEYQVIDASKAIGANKDPLGEAEYAVLASKMLGRMIEVGADGKPQIASVDNKMQKKLHSTGDLIVYELRMVGKNRMYFELTETGDHSYRLVILGAHGGDEASQINFINRITRVDK